MVTEDGRFGPRIATNSSPAATSAVAKKMLEELFFPAGITNWPDALVVACPSTAGRPGVASNKVTGTLASGTAEAVPPVWTTPLSAMAFADEPRLVAVSIRATATHTKPNVSAHALIKISLPGLDPAPGRVPDSSASLSSRPVAWP